MELRAEIRLDGFVPFDPYVFANHYGIQVVRLSELSCEERRHFLQEHGSAFSGALIPIGTKLVILENDAQPMARRRTTMCHELAHVVLEHEFGISIARDERKCGLGAAQEKEADRLAGEVLLPYEAAIRLAIRDATDAEVAAAFDVSLAVARWRMNGSGARLVARRWRAKQRVTSNASLPGSARSGPGQDQ